MAKQIKSRRISRTQKNSFEVRQLWLAAIGAVSLSRKQGAKLYSSMLTEGRSLQDRVNETVASVSGQVTGAIGQVRERAEAVVTPLRARAEAAIAVVKTEVETRLQPVLVRFGFASKAPAKRRPASKRVTRKPAAKRVVRKRKAA